MRPASPSAWWSPTPIYGENCHSGSQAVRRADPLHHGTQALAWHMAAGRRSRQPTGVHPSGSRGAPAPRRLGADRALRQPWQGTRALHGRTGTGAELWPDQGHAPDRGHPRSQAAQARIHLVSGDVFAAGARSAPSRSTRSIACAIGLSTTTSRSSMNWAGRITRCAPNGRLCAIGSS